MSDIKPAEMKIMRKVIAAFAAGYPVDKSFPDPLVLMPSAYMVTLCVCDDGACFQLRQNADEPSPRWEPFPPIPGTEADVL